MPVPSKNFTTILDAAVAPDAPIDTALVTGLRDNDIHLKEALYFGYTAAQAHNHDGANSALVSITSSAQFAAGVVNTAALGASQVTQAKIGSAAVGQAQLKTTTTSGTVTAGTIGTKTFALGGGSYSWYTVTGVSGSGVGPFLGGGPGSLGTLGWYANDNADALTIYERYVQSSPPYNNGPLFVFLQVRPNGTFAGIRVMPDPPWAYHGPTNIQPEFYSVDGKPYRLVETIDGQPLRKALRDVKLANAFAAGKLSMATEPMEITLDYKDSDMALVPHPFDPACILPDHTIVLLEPGTSLMQRFAQICDLDQAGEVLALIQAGELIVDNNFITVPKTPPGVQVARARLKPAAK